MDQELSHLRMLMHSMRGMYCSSRAFRPQPRLLAGRLLERGEDRACVLVQLVLGNPFNLRAHRADVAGGAVGRAAFEGALDRVVALDHVRLAAGRADVPVGSGLLVDAVDGAAGEDDVHLQPNTRVSARQNLCTGSVRQEA